MSLVGVNKGGLLVLVSDLVTNDSRSNLSYGIAYFGLSSRRRLSIFSFSLFIHFFVAVLS